MRVIACWKEKEMNYGLSGDRHELVEFKRFQDREVGNCRQSLRATPTIVQEFHGVHCQKNNGYPVGRRLR